jgi:hypothetical protein
MSNKREGGRAALPDRPLVHLTKSYRSAGQAQPLFHGFQGISFSSTLRTLSSIVCSRSIRVPNRMLVEIRGAPTACRASWHGFTAAKTRSQSPSIVVPYARRCDLNIAAVRMRSQMATSLETDPDTDGLFPNTWAVAYGRIGPNTPGPRCALRFQCRMGIVAAQLDNKDPLFYE